FDSVTPQLALGYTSGGGGVVGMGWSFNTPSIERMTYRGLPEYDLLDDFAVGASDQLVLIPGSAPPTYRHRFEKQFVRYTWMDAGEGQEGYWIAEYPDGSKGYFGATADGITVPEARMGTTARGTFRYMLVEKVDVYGHKMVMTYTTLGGNADDPNDRPGVPLVTSIGYVYTTNPSTPTYRVDFTYEERMDETGLDYLSDGKAGFN
ncbi:MAG: SpvB/TcaC N-terminal domain-containing protein, partial [Myxococcota bacterium]